MFRNDFPDLRHLKHMIAERDNNNWGWPNVVINAKTRQADRPDIKGTLSIFSNIKGSSYCEADGHKVRVEDDMFFISNDKQFYTLYIEENSPTETFNIHFSTSMLTSFLNDSHYSNDRMLDNAGNEQKLHIDFHNQLYRKDEQFKQITEIIYTKGNNGELNDLMTDELLSSLLYHLQGQYHSVRQNIGSIGTAKAVTREEIYARLSIATDYIHSYYNTDITLDELAVAASMSKFHFLRLFKEVYKTTPYKYMTAVRMQKAAQLVIKQAINEVAFAVGYDDASVFSRAFHKYHGTWPQTYRGMVLGK